MFVKELKKGHICYNKNNLHLYITYGRLPYIE